MKKSPSRRVPLWLTIVPLFAALALYGLLWRGWADDFEAEITRWLPQSALQIGGFPYRLEAVAAQPSLSAGEVFRLQIKASSARINRGPWRPNPTVIRFEAPRASAGVSPAISAEIEAKSALASINWGEGRLRRQSSIYQVAAVRLGASPLKITADTLETHLREQTGEPVPDTAPTLATHGQLVLAATRLRLGGGDALTMAAEVLATGAARLVDYDRWADGGTLELTRFTLSDAQGEVLAAKATLAPQGRTGLTIAGTVTTVCPASVAAAFAQTPAPAEKRLRVPVRLAFEGRFEALTLASLPDLTRRPRRDQEPDCPRLRN